MRVCDADGCSPYSNIVTGFVGNTGVRLAVTILGEHGSVTSAPTGIKYAIRVLLGPIRPPEPIRRPRAAHYGVDVRQALTTAWTAANGICGKRLVLFLPELVSTLDRHGHLSLMSRGSGACAPGANCVQSGASSAQTILAAQQRDESGRQPLALFRDSRSAPGAR